MSGRLVGEVLDYSRAPDDALAVLVAIAEFANDRDRTAHPGNPTLARRARKHVSKMPGLLNVLVRLGEIELVGDRRGGRGRKTRWRINDLRALYGARLHEPGPAVAAEKPSRLTAASQRFTDPETLSTVETLSEDETLSETLSPYARARVGTGEPEQQQQPPESPSSEGDRLKHFDRWPELLDLLRAEVTEFTFEIWFREIQPRGLTPDGTLVIAAPTHVASWLRDRYRLVLAAAASGVAQRPVPVQIEAEATSGRPRALEPTDAALSPERRRELRRQISDARTVRRAAKARRELEAAE